MKPILALQKRIQTLYRWYGKKTVWIAAAVVLLLVFVGIVIGSGANEATPRAAHISLPAVRLAPVATLSNQTEVSLIGTVEATDQARIESETSGRVTRVAVALGDEVTAGTIIAELENASERAAVLQAQGAYDAARAARAQSNLSARTAGSTLINAENAGINTFQSAWATADSVILGTIDTLFSDPTGRIPGFRLDAAGEASRINDERVAVEALRQEWSARAFSADTSENARALLADAEHYLGPMIALAESMARAAAHENNDNKTVNGTGIVTIRTNLASARTSLISARQSVESAVLAIENAEGALERAQIGGTNAELSAANAGVTQALGALRAAQARLDQTIIRTPIAGTVNAVEVKTSDFIGTLAPVATVANNNVLEITTYIGADDRRLIAAGDIVRIDRQGQGRISRIAPALSSETGKIEVKIATDMPELQNGDTVQVVITPSGALAEDAPLYLPLTAVRLSATDAFVFTVEQNVLIAHPVTLGRPQGTRVLITDGIDRTWNIVVDARGLNQGAEVEVR